MKPILAIIFFDLIGLNLTAQENILPPNSSPRSDVFILDSLVDWGWDSLSADWYLNHRTIYTYDDNQNSTEETESTYDVVQGWYDVQRSLNTYDAENRLTNVIDQNWDGFSWVNTDQLVYTYDGNGDLVLQSYKNWDGTSFVDFYQQIFTYDNNHNILTRISQVWNGTLWNNGTRQVSVYNANNLLTIRVNQSWNGAWNDVTRTLYTYDVNNDLDTLLSQKWSFNAWNDDYRSVYDFDAHHNRTFIKEQLAIGIGVWEDQEKYEYMYDQFDNVTHLVNSDYDNGNWIPVYQYNIINDDDQNRSSEVFQNWENGWENADSTQYYYTNLTGVKEILAPHVMSLYPNPTNDQLNIEFEKAFEGQISIYTVQGKLVAQERNFSENVARVNVSGCLPGQYIIVLRSGNGVVAKAFQKL